VAFEAPSPNAFNPGPSLSLSAHRLPEGQRGQRADHDPLHDREPGLDHEIIGTDAITFLAATASVVKLHDKVAPRAA